MKSNVYKDPLKVEIKEELQKLKATGDAPQWMSWMAYGMLKSNYMASASTPKERYRQIADHVAQYMGDEKEKWSDIFFDLIWKNWLCPSTPVMGNAGNPNTNAQCISCSATYVGDSMEEIAYKEAEVAMLSKYGFGTAAYLDLRGGRSPISTGGNTNPISDWVDSYHQKINKVSQGPLRRGACAFYIDLGHSDFFEVLDMLKTYERLNIGVLVKESDIEKIKAKEGDYFERYKHLLKWRSNRGMPYIIFITRAQEQDPECYKKLGLSTKQSNLCCLTGDTQVRVDNGKSMSIDQIVNTGYKIIHTGENQSEAVYFLNEGIGRVYNVHLSNGNIIGASLNHYWYYNGESFTTEDIINDLKEGKEVFLDNIDIGKVSVTKVVDTGKDDYLYCCMTGTQRFVLADGTITGNSEVFLHTDENHTLSCVLSAMNVARFDEWCDTDAVFNSIVFLDCVAEDLIKRGHGIKGLERVVRHTKKGRALGLGVLGFHSYVQSKSAPLDSIQARGYNHKIFSHIQKESKRASKWLAEKLGEPEWCKGSGYRNTHTNLVPPGTSSSIFSGGISQGIEPFTANVFSQSLSKLGDVDRINPDLLKILRQKGKYTDEVLDSISSNKGSVQHLDFLSDHEKEVFKTAFEINQIILIDLAEQRQEFLDQGQSLNLFFDSDCPEEWFHEVHKHAFETCKLLKSLYYVRSISGIKADMNPECIACSV